jgi:hypothetical protein
MNRNLYKINVLKLMHSRHISRAHGFTKGITVESVLLIFFRYGMSVSQMTTYMFRNILGWYTNENVNACFRTGSSLYILSTFAYTEASWI